MVARLEDRRHPLPVALAELGKVEQLAETHDRPERRTQLVAHAREELVLRGVRGTKLCVRVLQLLRAAGDLRFLPALALLHEHELRHVFDAMDDVGDALPRVEHRRVVRAPVALLEPSPLLLGPGDERYWSP